MNHAGRTAERQHGLRWIRQREVHWEQAEFLMDHLGDHDIPVLKPLLQAFLQQGIGQAGSMGEGGLLDKEHTIAQIHRVEKRWWSRKLLAGEMVAPVVHENETPLLDRIP